MLFSSWLTMAVMVPTVARRCGRPELAAQGVDLVAEAMELLGGASRFSFERPWSRILPLASGPAASYRDSAAVASFHRSGRAGNLSGQAGMDAEGLLAALLELAESLGIAVRTVQTGSVQAASLVRLKGRDVLFLEASAEAWPTGSTPWRPPWRAGRSWPTASCSRRSAPPWSGPPQALSGGQVIDPSAATPGRLSWRHEHRRPRHRHGRLRPPAGDDRPPRPEVPGPHLHRRPSRTYCRGKKRAIEHLAGRFAAKEAVLKVLGTGWRNGITWTDIEVRNSPSGPAQRAPHRPMPHDRRRAGPGEHPDLHQPHRHARDRLGHRLQGSPAARGEGQATDPPPWPQARPSSCRRPRPAATSTPPGSSPPCAAACRRPASSAAAGPRMAEAGCEVLADLTGRASMFGRADPAGRLLSSGPCTGYARPSATSGRTC